MNKTIKSKIMRKKGCVTFMSPELIILSTIHENNRVTQRLLADVTHMSLGAINALLREMIAHGFIQAKPQNARSVRYILTPLGIEEKEKRVRGYIKQAYESAQTIRRGLSQIVDGQKEKSTLYLYGEGDEVCHMITMILNELSTDSNISFKKIDSAENLDPRSTVIIWDSADEKKLDGTNCINILEKLI